MGGIACIRSSTRVSPQMSNWLNVLAQETEPVPVVFTTASRYTTYGIAYSRWGKEKKKKSKPRRYPCTYIIHFWVLLVCYYYGHLTNTFTFFPWKNDTWTFSAAISHLRQIGKKPSNSLAYLHRKWKTLSRCVHHVLTIYNVRHCTRGAKKKHLGPRIYLCTFMGSSCLRPLRTPKEYFYVLP